MSGFEVVGVVLGAIPLLISGLEHYAEGIHTIKNMWDYEAVVRHLVTEFMLSQGILRHSCQDLLMPILPDTEATKLLEGGAPNWEDEDLAKRLREFLGPDYEVYVRTVRNLNRRIEFFTRKLALDKRTMLPPWMANAEVDKGVRDKFFRHTWKHIKGGFDTSAVSRLLADIQRYISQIAEFTRGSIAVAPKRVALQRRAKSRCWLQIRDHARRLFENLGSHWSCACPHPHRASLRLDIRRSYTMHEEEEVKFNVLFSYDIGLATTSSAPLLWKWREVDIQPLPSTSKPVTSTVMPRPPGAKRVSFNVPSTSQSSVAGPSVSAPQSSSPPASKINDLCNVLSQPQHHSSCMGYFDDHEFQQHMFMSAHSMNFGEAHEIACFYDVLRRKGVHCLGVKEKYELALTVASAVLQLHSTPWLKEKWCLDDIHFIRGNGISPLFARAYVTTSFVPANWTQGSIDLERQPSPQACACVANETIFALGVALIEISFGVPILSLKESIDPDLPGFPGLTEFCIATRLVNQNAIKDRDHDKYAEVVLRCVKGQLSTLATPLSLEDVKVQQSFYDEIILPLQRLNTTLHENNDVATV